MRKEARYNLIFLIVLLALCLPGVIMLVSRKLHQQGDMRGGMSAPVPHLAVYVDPLPKGSNIRGLVIPPQTHAWALSLGGRTAVDDRVFISRERSFEVVDLTSNPPHLELTILLWDPRLGGDRGLLRATVERDGQPIDAEVSSVEPITLPDEIRGELQRSGYSAAPGQIHIARVRLADDRNDGILVLQRIAGGASHQDRIDLQSIAF